MNRIFLLLLGIGAIAFLSKKKPLPILGTDLITPDGIVHFQTPVAP